MKARRDKQLYFKTNVLLKSIIGRDLINNDNIAVLELIKNSFDAGSKKVEVVLNNIKKNDDEKLKEHKYTNKTSKIIIIDTGSGMSDKDLKDKWLNIAYSEKIITKEAFGRTLAGNKGIGRFSCDRLGRYLDIYTKTTKDKSYWHLKVDWTLFELESDKDREIQNIPVEFNLISIRDFPKKSGHPQFKHGTIIEISALRANWNEREGRKRNKLMKAVKILDMKKYLERLINPNQIIGKTNEFVIDIEAKEFVEEDSYWKKAGNEYNIINGKVKNKIFDKLDFKTTAIEAEINERATTLKITLNDKGRRIFEFIEDISSKAEYRYLNNAKVVLYFLNPYAKAFFVKQTGLRSVDFGSVYLFKNGFRISPYGDTGNDWLGLEVRKGQGQRRFLGTRDLVGRIEIVDEKGVFKEVTSREGLVQNSAFHNLTEVFFMDVLKMLETYVVKGLMWDSVPTEILEAMNTPSALNEDDLFKLSKEEKDRNAMKILGSILKLKSKKIRKLEIHSELIAALALDEKDNFDKVYSEISKHGESALNKISKQDFKKVRALIEKQEQRINELKSKAIQVDTEESFSKDHAEDNERVVALQHHINQATERINTRLQILQDAIMNGLSPEVMLKQVDRISFENKKIGTLSKFVTKAKFNMLTTLIEKDLVSFIQEYVAHVYEDYSYRRLNRDLMEVILTVPEKFSFVKEFRPLDIIIVLDNLLDNAMHAKAKVVLIDIAKISQYKIRISVKDDGKGLEKTIKDPNQIFKFGFTTRHGGTGIGLFHVKDTLEKMKGSIKVNPNLKQGLEFIIDIEK